MAFRLSSSKKNPSPDPLECLNYSNITLTLSTEIACESYMIYICSL